MDKATHHSHSETTIGTLGTTSRPELEQILKRSDIWRGRGESMGLSQSVSTGFEALNNALVNKGWPLGTLIEACQTYHASEWLLFSPSLKKLCQSHHYIALLNPPTLPYAVGLIRNDLPLDQIIIIQPRNKNDFIASFVELGRSNACCAVIAWQPKQSLNYTELRKCQLASNDNNSLQVLFRHRHARQQNSPASLRFMLTPQYKYLQVQIFKQRGQVGSHVTQIKLPRFWQAFPPHPYLDGSIQEFMPQRKQPTLHHIQGGLP